MNTRLRSAMLLAMTLVVGIVIGAAGSREIARLWLPGGPPPENSPDNRANGRDSGREDPAASPFVVRMERAIEPRDSAQQAVVRAILVRTAQSNRSVIQTTNQTLRALVDSMRVELAPLLDEAQRARLDEETRRLAPVGPRRGPPDGRGRPGRPPRGGEPPR